MSKGKGIFRGLLGALVVCLLSFAVIYFLVPDLSSKAFGFSFKDGTVSEEQREVSQVINGVRTSLKDSGATEEQITAIVEQLKNSDVWESIKDGAADSAEKVGRFVSDAARNVKLDVDLKSIEAGLAKVDFQKLGKTIGSFASDAFSALLKKVN